MKIVVVFGQNNKGNTSKITRLLISKLNATKKEITEFCVEDLPSCVGCGDCIKLGEKSCPSNPILEDILKAMDNADVIILESPTYCLEMSSKMKNFCEHMAFRWMCHRPNIDYNKKVGISISASKIGGNKKVCKSLSNQMFWWGIGKTYQLGFATKADAFDKISPDKIAKLQFDTLKLAQKVNNINFSKTTQTLKGKLYMAYWRMQRKNDQSNSVDTEYWKENNWLK